MPILYMAPCCVDGFCGVDLGAVTLTLEILCLMLFVVVKIHIQVHKITINIPRVGHKNVLPLSYTITKSKFMLKFFFSQQFLFKILTLGQWCHEKDTLPHYPSPLLTGELQVLIVEKLSYSTVCQIHILYLLNYHDLNPCKINVQNKCL